MTEEQMKLVEDNSRFPYYMVNKYFSNTSNLCPYADKEDLYQVANAALVKAARTFDTSRGNFSSYAGLVIMNDIRLFLRYNTTNSTYGGRYRFKLEYLDAPYKADKNGEFSPLQDFIPDPNGLEDTIADEDYITYVYNKFWSSLTEKEKQIVTLKSKGLDQTEISKKVDLSQSYVSRIIIKLKARLKSYLAKGGYK